MQPARRPRAKLPPRKPFFPKVRARWLPARRPAGIPGDEIEPRRSTCHDFTLTIEVRDRYGDPVVAHLATRAMITADGDTPPATTFRELVNDPGTVKRTVSAGRTAGLVSPTWGGIELNNTAGDFDGWTEHVCDGGKVTCRYGPRGGAYPEEWRTAYIAYIDGAPQFDAKTMRLALRGRERLLERQVVAATFVPPVPLMQNGVDLGGTGVAGSRRKFLVLGTPGYVEPILVDELDNLWFNGANPLIGGSIRIFDGGSELQYGGIVGGTYPGQFAFHAQPHGAVYTQLGSTIRFAARQLTTGGYSSPTESLRRWNIVDLVRRAGLTDVTAGTLPAGSELFDAGNRVIENQTYKEVLTDIAAFEVASVGFSRLDQFYCRRIEPSWMHSPRYTFTDGINARRLTVAPISGLEKRVWQVQVQAGETHKSALAGVIDDDVRDALSRDPWLVNFEATAQSVHDLDPSAERDEVQIVGNQFTTRADMQAWALRYLRVYGSHPFGASIEAPLDIDNMAIDLLDVVSLVSPATAARPAATRWCGRSTCCSSSASSASA